MFWTNGGPGASSISSWFQGISKTLIKPDTTTLDNPHTWSRFSTIVTVDQPIGSGFSYLKEGDEYRDNYDQVSLEYCQFLMEFLSKKGYLSNDNIPNKIIIVGESLAGHFIPQTTNCLVNHLKDYNI
jgi:carboxypeptidase C (cathepsin A)